MTRLYLSLFYINFFFLLWFKLNIFSPQRCRATWFAPSAKRWAKKLYFKSQISENTFGAYTMSHSRGRNQKMARFAMDAIYSMIENPFGSIKMYAKNTRNSLALKTRREKVGHFSGKKILNLELLSWVHKILVAILRNLSKLSMIWLQKAIKSLVPLPQPSIKTTTIGQDVLLTESMKFRRKVPFYQSIKLMIYKATLQNHL